MICKTIKVGKGVGPTIDCSRYSKIRVHVTGLKSGDVYVHTEEGTAIVATDSILDVPDTEKLVVSVQSKDCVIVKLTAEVVCLTPQ